MDFEGSRPLQLIFWKLGESLEKVVCNSHRPHRVGTRWSRAHFVELFQSGHDWTLRLLHYCEIRRKWRSNCRRLGDCFRGFLLGTSRQQRSGRCGKGSVSEFPPSQNLWSLILTRGRCACSTSSRTAAPTRASGRANHIKYLFHSFVLLS